MRKRLMLWGSVFLGVVVFASWPRAGQGGDRPNIILLMGDDHGWEETGYNGHAHLQTPVLDEMAASGLRFDRFYAGHPSCSPTRGSVLTGRHPVRYGTFAPNWSIRPEETTLAHVLGTVGYATAHFGKWHVGPVKATSPTNPGAMGFGQWLSHDNFFELDPVLSRDGGTPERFEGESSDVLIDEAIRFIDRAADQDTPFLAVVWFGSPHEPYSGLAEDLAAYDNLPERYGESIVTLTSNETGNPIRRPLREVLRERYAEITAMDRAIGRLRRHLDRAGLRDDTLLWYKGDNGTPPSGVADMPLRGQKGTMYEGGIRVPGLLEWPARVSAPRVTDVPAVTSDILPTLAGLAGAALPERPLDGISLVPLLNGMMSTWPEPIFFSSFNIDGLEGRSLEPYIDPEQQEGTTPLVKLMDGISTRIFQNVRFSAIQARDFAGTRVIMDGDYKLVVRGEEASASELFDLRGDPSETRDLTVDEPDVVARMQRQLREWQQSVLQSLTGADYDRETVASP